MKVAAAIFSVLALAACVQQKEVSSVQVILPLATPSRTTDGTLLGECHITGEGDRTGYEVEDEDSFNVFASREARAPALVIATPARVRVAWSQFPSAISARTRAHLEIGGQRHVRFAGFASLSGRTFSVAKRFYAEPGHLWARIGAPVEMLAAEGATAYARVKTPFVAPTSMVVRGACGNVMYEPEVEHERDVSKRNPIADVLNRTVTLDLYAEPNARQSFTTLTIDGAQSLAMDELEVRDGFARVAADLADVGFDAWVPLAQVTEDPGTFSGIGLSGFGTSSHCGGGLSMVTGTVARDTALFVGASPEALAGAVIEKDAAIMYGSSDEVTVDGKIMVWFFFLDGYIAAPGDARLWIAKDAVQ